MLSDGDLRTEVVSVHSRDELELMSMTLNTTVESINQYISDIHQVLTRVADGNLNARPQMDYKGEASSGFRIPFSVIPRKPALVAISSFSFRRAHMA